MMPDRSSTLQPAVGEATVIAKYGDDDKGENRDDD
jgi:hypothetical protein